ncbi:hypothetical protein DFP73DRAFT_275894 [Morchella snyderi]|nr:hypothetical protein DFP73DRAFT_275894 [Morchella snyderi]
MHTLPPRLSFSSIFLAPLDTTVLFYGLPPFSFIFSLFHSLSVIFLVPFFPFTFLNFVPTVFLHCSIIISSIQARWFYYSYLCL